MYFKLIQLKLKAILLVFVLLLSVNPAYAQSTTWIPEHTINAEININSNNKIEIKNFRQFRHSLNQPTKHQYADKVQNLNNLKTLDYLITPIGPFGIAHVMLSFGFENPVTKQIDDYIVISPEVRTRQNSRFYTFATFFNLYEIFYVVADEKDIIDHRTRILNNEIHLYNLNLEQNTIQNIFKNFSDRINNSKHKREIYNTVNNNCYTIIFDVINESSKEELIPREHRFIVPENSDRVFYSLGLMSTNLPFLQTKQTSSIKNNSVRFHYHQNYSQLIRQYKNFNSSNFLTRQNNK